MKSNSKVSVVLLCAVASLLLVNCNEVEINPVSPTPVVRDINVEPPAINIPSPTVSNTQSVARESFSYQLGAMAHSGLTLEGVNGTVNIVGSSGAATVEITGERLVKSETTEDARRHLEKLEVRIEDLGSEFWVRTVQPENSNGPSYVVNYTITLPKKWSVVVSELNGDVSLKSIHGSAYVDLLNGRIEGDLVLPTDGEIDMKTMNGGIDLRIPARTSAEFSADVMNGSINVANLDLHHTVKDRNSLRGTLGDGRGRVSLRTTNGRIDVRGF
jgi:hypothetical protein